MLEFDRGKCCCRFSVILKSNVSFVVKSMLRSSVQSLFSILLIEKYETNVEIRRKYFARKSTLNTIKNSVVQIHSATGFSTNMFNPRTIVRWRFDIVWFSKEWWIGEYFNYENFQYLRETSVKEQETIVLHTVLWNV